MDVDGGRLTCGAVHRGGASLFPLSFILSRFAGTYKLQPPTLLSLAAQVWPSFCSLFLTDSLFTSSRLGHLQCSLQVAA